MMMLRADEEPELGTFQPPPGARKLFDIAAFAVVQRCRSAELPRGRRSPRFVIVLVIRRARGTEAGEVTNCGAVSVNRRNYGAIEPRKTTKTQKDWQLWRFSNQRCFHWSCCTDMGCFLPPNSKIIEQTSKITERNKMNKTMKMTWTTLELKRLQPGCGDKGRRSLPLQKRNRTSWER